VLRLKGQRADVRARAICGAAEHPQVFDQIPLALFKDLPGFIHTDSQRTSRLFDMPTTVMHLHEYSAMVFGKRSDYINNGL
jgi:hypothetical protein